MMCEAQGVLGAAFFTVGIVATVIACIVFLAGMILITINGPLTPPEAPKPPPFPDDSRRP